MTYVNKGSVLAVGIIFIVLGISAVIARFQVRRKIGLGVDDWLCLPALVLVIAECSIMIVGSATNTVGQHSPTDVNPVTYDGADQITLEELEYPFDLMQVVTLMLLKLAFLFFYRRIFRGRAFNIVSWTLIGIVVAWATAFFIAILAACGPSIRTNFSTLGALKAKCVNTFVVLVCLAVFDVAVDLSVMIFPIPLVWRLQMPIKRKIAVITTFLVGALAIACGTTRMAIFAELLGPALFSQSDVAGVSTSDSIGIVSILMFWGMLEMGVAMVAVCLPTLRPLFHTWSLESIIHSFLSVLSLSSRNKSYHSFPEDNERGRGETETSLAKAKSSVYDAHVNQHQAYAMGPIGAQQGGSVQMTDGEVRVNKKLTQTVEVV